MAPGAKVNYKSYEAQARLVRALVAAHPEVKWNYKGKHGLLSQYTPFTPVHSSCLFLSLFRKAQYSHIVKLRTASLTLESFLSRSLQKSANATVPT